MEAWSQDPGRKPRKLVLPLKEYNSPQGISLAQLEDTDQEVTARLTEVVRASGGRLQGYLGRLYGGHKWGFGDWHCVDLLVDMEDKAVQAGNSLPVWNGAGELLCEGQELVRGLQADVSIWAEAC